MVKKIELEVQKRREGKTFILDIILDNNGLKELEYHTIMDIIERLIRE